MSLFKSDDEKKAEKLQESILENLTRTHNLVEDFRVTFCDGAVTLSGQCDTSKTRKKAILFADMAEGVTDVQSGALTVLHPDVPDATPSAETEATVSAANPPAFSSDATESTPSAKTVPPAVPSAAPPTPHESGNSEGHPSISASQAAPAAEPAPRSVPPTAGPKPVSQSYTIQKGDTLSKIAKQFYGDATKYMIIVEANQELIKDPDKIYPGQDIQIPPLS